MWMLNTSRRDLVERLTSKNTNDWGELRQWHAGFELGVHSDQLALVWRNHPGEVGDAPPVVVVSEKGRRDFLAWIVTYLPDFRPFTSFFRVVSPDVATRCLDQPQSAVRNSFEAYLGLILAEAALYGASSPEGKQLTPVACASTCSYITARSLFSSCTLSDVDQVQSAWFRARTITKQARLPLSSEQLLVPWRVLLALGEKSRTRPADLAIGAGFGRILEACLELQDQPELSPSMLGALLNGLGNLDLFNYQPTRTREERVANYEAALRLFLSAARPDTIEAPFCLGYLASQIAPGTLDYLQLLAPIATVFPTAFLWYGLVAGLAKNQRLSSVGGGLGRRVLRDVMAREDFLAPPHCDIALAELEMLTSSEAAHGDIRVGAQGQLEVELIPCVNTVLRWPPRSEMTGDLFGNRLLFEAQEVMTELNDVMARVDFLRSRLSNVLNVQDKKPGKRAICGRGSIFCENAHTTA